MGKATWIFLKVEEPHRGVGSSESHPGWETLAQISPVHFTARGASTQVTAPAPATADSHLGHALQKKIALRPDTDKDAHS